MITYLKNLLLATLSPCYANKLKKYNLVIEDGKIRTLNKKGWVHHNLDEINSIFLNDIHKGNKVLVNRRRFRLHHT